MCRQFDSKNASPVTVLVGINLNTQLFSATEIKCSTCVARAHSGDKRDSINATADTQIIYCFYAMRTQIVIFMVSVHFFHMRCRRNFHKYVYHCHCVYDFTHILSLDRCHSATMHGRLTRAGDKNDILVQQMINSPSPYTNPCVIQRIAYLLFVNELQSARVSLAISHFVIRATGQTATAYTRRSVGRRC